MRDVVFFCCYFILPPRMQSWRWTISTSGQFAYALLAQETVVCLVGPFTSPDVDAAMAAMGTEPVPFPKRASDAPSAPLFHFFCSTRPSTSSSTYLFFSKLNFSEASYHYSHDVFASFFTFLGRSLPLLTPSEFVVCVRVVDAVSFPERDEGIPLFGPFGKMG
jgi:hypothetical protein